MGASLHTCINGNEIADTLANEGTLIDKPTPTPHIHITHTTPYWLACCPTVIHSGAIQNLHTFVTQAHKNRETRMTKFKFPYVDKWTSNTQLNQKNPITFGKTLLENHDQINKQSTDLC
jgi:hypothetical protein